MSAPIYLKTRVPIKLKSQILLVFWALVNVRLTRFKSQPTHCRRPIWLQTLGLWILANSLFTIAFSVQIVCPLLDLFSITDRRRTDKIRPRCFSSCHLNLFKILSFITFLSFSICFSLYWLWQVTKVPEKQSGNLPLNRSCFQPDVVNGGNVDLWTTEAG